MDQLPWQWLPNPWRQALMGLPHELQTSLEEVRFRLGRPVVLYGGHGWQPLVAPKVPECVTQADLNRIVDILADFSLYARLEELRQGFLTLPGGHRVGLAGYAVGDGGQIATLRTVTGLNFRRARAFTDIGLSVMEAVGSPFGSWLLAGPPRSGKTTFLRDLIRLWSNRGLRVVVIDERLEIAGGSQSEGFSFDLGLHTDVLEAWPKLAGISVAIRTLGPDVIAVDEIGSVDELAAVSRARQTGVTVLATVHARDWRDLEMRPEWQPFWSAWDAVIGVSPHDAPRVWWTHAGA
ncbi:MAG: ATPase, T2SS/T4P/T4SS family [Sulfobacillus sp.]|nr:ATPase, T2SS/T4P/T4SS family [Sulfobacillus sp.]